MKIWEFSKWVARRMIAEPLAWAVILMILGLVAAAAGCPAPWPGYTTVLGAGITLIYTLRMALQIAYERYQREQQDIVDRLRRK
jgi:hypothetical protein